MLATTIPHLAKLKLVLKFLEKDNRQMSSSRIAPPSFTRALERESGSQLIAKLLTDSKYCHLVKGTLARYFGLPFFT
jgi:hypothetical protein